MNIITKYLSLSIVVLSLFTSIITQCMRIKSLKITPTRIKHYSSHTTNPILPQYKKQPIALEYEHIDWQSPTNTFQKLENAKEALTDKDWATQDAARDFLIKRIAQKQDLELIAKITEKAWRTPPKKTHSVWHTQRSVLQIYKALAQQDCALEIAMHVASIVTTNTWGSINNLGRDIFTILLQKNYPPAFETAAHAAATACREEDDLQIRDDGFKLFKTLFEHDQGFETYIHKVATQTAQDLTQYKDDNAKQLAIKLLNAVEERNKAHNDRFGKE